MRRAALLVVLIGCGGAAPCTATFTGNYTDLVTGTCPTLDAGTLALDSRRLTLSVELGASARAGTFSSATLSGPWRALSAREPGCVYSAGSAATPAGSFTLELQSLQPVHGRLEVLQSMHALGGADCGPVDTERVVLEF